LTPLAEHLRDDSLSRFLLVTGVGWVGLYATMNSETKEGQLVGNTVSEWTEIFGLLRLRKRLIEPRSKQSNPGHK
jgi:hypothetical protein